VRLGELRLAKMKQIKTRWGDLGPPTQPGNYRHGLYTVRVTRGDIELASGKPDAMLIAIQCPPRRPI
jgi:hypothetical protein